MLHLVHILEATTGGTRRHLWHLVTGLDPSRFRQSLIVSPLRDPAFREDVAAYRELGVDVRLVPMLRGPAPWHDAAAAVRIARTLRDLAPDMVHTHSSKAGLLGRWAADRVGVPRCVHTPHVFAYEMDVARLWRTLYLAAECMASRWTDGLVCVSDAEAGAARRLGRFCPPVCVVRNGVDAPTPASAAPLDDTPLRVALLGRSCRQKGQDTLATAMLRFPEIAEHCRVEMTGVDPAVRLPAEVRRAVDSGLCRILPPQAPTEIQAYLEEQAVVVLPSRWEGLPYTLLEAMAAGRCVVASAVGGVPEVVRDGVNGLLVAPDDPGALAGALLRIVRDRDQARTWGRAARKTVLRKFRKDAMLKALSGIYEGRGTWNRSTRSGAR